MNRWLALGRAALRGAVRRPWGVPWGVPVRFAAKPKPSPMTHPVGGVSRVKLDVPRVPPPAETPLAQPPAQAPATPPAQAPVELPAEAAQPTDALPTADQLPTATPFKNLPRAVQQYITKQQLLARASGFLDRLRVRFKWLVTRLLRPFSTDDFSALFSWLVISNGVLLVVGTTTFVLLVVLTANTVFAQEYVARKLGELITLNLNLTVLFELAIVPLWNSGKVSFNKCFVLRRPKRKASFAKGHVGAAALASMEEDEEDDGNYTQFDLTIEQINCLFLFRKWINGHGILQDVEVRGVRGVVDRTHVFWMEGDLATNYKNVAAPGDFEIERFRAEDVLFTLKQPGGFREFDVLFYNMDLPQFRKHWLFYDMLNANTILGAYDGALFTIHKKQRMVDFQHLAKPAEASPWARVLRLRVDSLNVDHLNTGLEGPFGWITQGWVDMEADFMVPEQREGAALGELVQMVSELITKEARRYNLISPDPAATAAPDASKYVVLDLKIKLNNVRAQVPLFTSDLLYVNNALVRPIVGFINSRNTYIPVQCRVVKRLSDFEGSWTVYDSLLMDDMSAEVYDAFALYVMDEEARTERLQRIAFWGLQAVLQVALVGLGVV